MNSKQRKQFARKIRRNFPIGSQVYVDGGDRKYTVTQHLISAYTAKRVCLKSNYGSVFFVHPNRLTVSICGLL